MIKIKICDYLIHRNQTTFRPYLNSADIFREVGIEFVFEGNKYDMAWIGQASYMDKTLSLTDSVNKGIEYLEQFKGQDYILFDGQDSATLKGSVEVFNQSEAKYLLKNTLYSDLGNYRRFSTTGRIYWEKNKWEDLYRVSIDQDFSRIKLSGTNWLSGIPFNQFSYSHATKDIDVFAMFQYPAKHNMEFGIETGKYYTAHRKNCIDQLKQIAHKYNIFTAEIGNVPLDDYYRLMSRSKIVVAPFGYGEIAPRDAESAQVGAILIKPDMDHIQTVPNIYTDPQNFMNAEWDYSDLGSIIDGLLTDYKLQQQYYVENFRRNYCIEYTTEKMVAHIYELIRSIEGYTI